MEVRFIPSESALTMLAAIRLLNGQPLGDLELAAALADPVANLKLLLDSKGVPIALAQRHLVPLAATIGSNYELADVLIRKLGAGADDPPFRVALVRTITELESAALRARPTLPDELKHTAAQLQTAWVRGGETLLQGIARLTEDRMIAEQAWVAVCSEAVGEMWEAYLPYNLVVATHPQGSADEHELTARLAWLLAQLQIDLPAYADGLLRTGPATVATLALVPAILAALSADASPYQEGVPPQLGGSCDEPSIRATLARWRPDFDADRFCGPLFDWWETYATGGGSWPVALAALDRLLAAS